LEYSTERGGEIKGEGRERRRKEEKYIIPWGLHGQRIHQPSTWTVIS
jgi:hypothetical protein